MEITNKSSHFLLKLKFLAIFATPGGVGEVDPTVTEPVETPVTSTGSATEEDQTQVIVHRQDLINEYVERYTSVAFYEIRAHRGRL